MKPLLLVQKFAEWVAMGAIALTLAVMLLLAVAPQMLAGYLVNQVADRFDSAGLDTRACSSLRTSPYVTGDGRCLKQPISEIRSRMPRFEQGGPEDNSNEAPPIE